MGKKLGTLSVRINFNRWAQIAHLVRTRRSATRSSKIKRFIKCKCHISAKMHIHKHASMEDVLVNCRVSKYLSVWHRYIIWWQRHRNDNFIVKSREELCTLGMSLWNVWEPSTFLFQEDSSLVGNWILSRQLSSVTNSFETPSKQGWSKPTSLLSQ